MDGRQRNLAVLRHKDQGDQYEQQLRSVQGRAPRREDISPAAQDEQIRLVVKGDDMGTARSNVATIDAYRRGILTTTNVIVPGAWFPEAVRLINENPTLDVGSTSR